MKMNEAFLAITIGGVMGVMRPGHTYKVAAIATKLGCGTAQLAVTMAEMERHGLLQSCYEGGKRAYLLPNASWQATPSQYVQRGAAWERVNERLTDYRAIKSKFD